MMYYNVYKITCIILFSYNSNKFIENINFEIIQKILIYLQKIGKKALGKKFQFDSRIKRIN